MNKCNERIKLKYLPFERFIGFPAMEKKSSVTKTGYENDKQNGRSLRLFYNGGVRNFGVYFLCGVDEGSDQRLPNSR